MAQFVFENFVNTTLAAAASSTATTLTLSSATELPSTLAQGQQIPLVLNSVSNGSVFETCYITGINGATVTVLRAQEGTSAQQWNVGDFAYVAMTAGTTAPVIATHNPTASETLPVANQLVVTPGTLTAGIDLTLNDTAAAGSDATVYGSAADYAVTVLSPVDTGSPYIELPDGSRVYSWTIPAGSPSQGIRAVWDGTNWRARTFGQEVVAPATQSNAAVQLGQVASVAPAYAQQAYTPSSGSSSSISVSFTAPSAGTVFSIYSISETQQPVNGTLQAIFNGVNGNSDFAEGSMLVMGVNNVTAGEACTATCQYTAGSSSSSFAGLLMGVAMIFVPLP